jgi:hypothetical protein
VPDSNHQHSPAEIKRRMEEVIKRRKQAQSQPHQDFSGKDGGKPHKGPAPKARNFRHQGR